VGMSKGDRRRDVDEKVYGDNFDSIYRKKTLTELYEESEKETLKEITKDNNEDRNKRQGTGSVPKSH